MWPSVACTKTPHQRKQYRYFGACKCHKNYLVEDCECRLVVLACVPMHKVGDLAQQCVKHKLCFRGVISHQSSFRYKAVLTYVAHSAEEPA